MDQVKAARRSLDLIDERLNDWTINLTVLKALPIDMQRDHLNDMVDQMERQTIDDREPEWSDGKLGRWLGWIQASGCAMGLLSLEECKQINMESK